MTSANAFTKSTVHESWPFERPVDGFAQFSVRGYDVHDAEERRLLLDLQRRLDAAGEALVPLVSTITDPGPDSQWIVAIASSLEARRLVGARRVVAKGSTNPAHPFGQGLVTVDPAFRGQGVRRILLWYEHEHLSCARGVPMRQHHREVYIHPGNVASHRLFEQASYAPQHPGSTTWRYVRLVAIYRR